MNFIKEKIIPFAQKRPVLLWTIIFLLFRLLFLFANDGFIFDADSHNIRFQEEFNNTDIARELLRGNWRLMDGIALAPGAVHGGEYLQVGLFTAVMKIFGQSYYAIKLLPICFSWLIFIIILLLLSQTMHKAAVHIYGVLATIAFPTSFISSFYGLGNHMEVALFIALGLAVSAALLLSPIRKNSLALFALLGLVCGFALFYNMIILSFFITLIPIGICVAIRYGKKRPDLLIAGIALFVICFAIGFSPYFPIHKSIKAPLGIDALALKSIPAEMQIGLDGYEKFPLRQDMIFLNITLSQEVSLKMVKNFFLMIFPGAFGFSSPIDMLYMLIILVLVPAYLFVLFKRIGDSHLRIISLLFFSFVIIHLLVTASFNAVYSPDIDEFIGYRHLFPALPFLVAWAAITITLLILEAPSFISKSAIGVFVTLLIFGLIGFSIHFSPKSFLKYRHLPGFSYDGLVQSVGDYFREYPGPPKDRCDQIRLYLSDCDPAFRKKIQRAIDEKCKNEIYQDELAKEQ